MTTIKLTIPFYDVDAMRITYHGNYIKYLEEARCQYLAERNMTYNDMEKLGYIFPIIELKVKYINPTIFGQSILVSITREECDNCLIFKYLITDEITGKKILKAETRQMCIDTQTNESLFIMPQVFLDKLKDN